MQNICDKIQLTTTNDCYVTCTDVKAGDMLLIEQPLFVTPHWDCEQMKCSNCMLDSFVMCKKCQIFPLCIDCKTHDAYDCTFFSSGGPAEKICKNILVKNYGIYALLKVLLLIENSQTEQGQGGVDCKALFSRAQQLKLHDAIAIHDQQQHIQVIQPLLQSGLTTIFNCLPTTDAADFLYRLCQTIDAHAFELLNREGDSLKGIYVSAARLPHSCVPNVCIAIDERTYRMHVYAALPLASGAVLHNSYVNPLLGNAQRQHHLRTSRGLKHCTCARCADPSELGTHMSTLKCTQCTEGLLLPPSKRPSDTQLENGELAKEPDWLCTVCNASLPAASVHNLLSMISDEFASVAGDLHATEELLCKYAKRLHAQHFLIIEMKQHLASLLRALTLLGVSAETDALLERRLSLCRDLLPLVRAVQPGISKLYAIALYEYFLSLRQFAELKYRQQHIDEITYGHKLLEAKRIAAEALNLLLFEPHNSPEGHLAQRLRHEEKQIIERLQHLNITNV